MYKCAFFGHRSCNYYRSENQLIEIIIDLIENHGVTEFYEGCRGDFDNFCGKIVGKLKKTYPHIKLMAVLSYMPEKDFDLPDYYDGSVYLLEERVPPRYAISRTNRLLVELVDYVVSGVFYTWGGAYQAVNYAKRLKKTVLELKDE